MITKVEQYRAIRAALDSVPQEQWTRELRNLNDLAGQMSPKKGRMILVIHGSKGTTELPMPMLKAIEKQRWWAENYPDIKVEVIPAPPKDDTTKQRKPRSKKKGS